jgi:hypothetical protein
MGVSSCRGLPSKDGLDGSSQARGTLVEIDEHKRNERIVIALQ